MNWFLIGLLCYLGIGALLGIIFVGVMHAVAYAFAKAEKRDPITIPSYRLFFTITVAWLPLFLIDK
jgi:hypothetical protein